MFKAFSLALLLSLSYCAPAFAGSHGFSPSSREDVVSMYDTIKTPMVLDTDQYQIIASYNKILSFTVIPHDEHYVDVVFHNELAPAWDTHEQIVFNRPDGLQIIVYLQSAVGDEPDVFTVIPPNGYIAIPMEMSVEEGEDGIIEIHAYTGT